MNSLYAMPAPTTGRAVGHEPPAIPRRTHEVPLNLRSAKPLGADLQQEMFVDLSPSFKLAWWCAIPAAGLCALAWVYSAGGGKIDQGYEASLRALLMVAGLTWCLVASAASYFVFRRSHRAANIAFCTMAMLGVFGQLGQAAARESGELGNEYVLGRLARLMDTRTPRATAPIEIASSTAPASSEDTLKVETARLIGTAQAAARVGGRLGAHVAEGSGTYDEAVREFLSAGGLSPKTMKSRADVQARLASLANVRQANERVTRTLAGTQDWARAQLEGEGVEGIEAARASTELCKGARLDELMKFRKTQADFVTAAERQLTLLHQNYGHWRLDEQRGMVFRSVLDAKKYQQLTAEVNTIARRESEMRRALADAAPREPEEQ